MVLQLHVNVKVNILTHTLVALLHIHVHIHVQLYIHVQACTCTYIEKYSFHLTCPLHWELNMLIQSGCYCLLYCQWNTFPCICMCTKIFVQSLHHSQHNPCYMCTCNYRNVNWVHCTMQIYMYMYNNYVQCKHVHVHTCDSNFACSKSSSSILSLRSAEERANFLSLSSWVSREFSSRSYNVAMHDTQ